MAIVQSKRDTVTYCLLHLIFSSVRTSSVKATLPQTATALWKHNTPVYCESDTNETSVADAGIHCYLTDGLRAGCTEKYCDTHEKKKNPERKTSIRNRNGRKLEVQKEKLHRK